MRPIIMTAVLAGAALIPGIGMASADPAPCPTGYNHQFEGTQELHPADENANGFVCKKSLPDIHEQDKVQGNTGNGSNVKDDRI